MQFTEKSYTPLVRSFVLTFVPVAILLLGLGLWTAQIQFEGILSKARSDQSAVLEIRTAILREVINDDLEKIQSISKDPGLDSILEADTPVSRLRLEDSFKLLLLRNRDFTQIRWIDETGREKVRVDQQNGEVIVASEDALQDKSQRQYFQEAMQLPIGSVYVSPLDLNVEYGKIVRPLQPMLRFATPIEDKLARPRGILIINMNAARLLDKLPRKHFTGSQLMWLDEAGQWLRAPSPGDEWGFQLGNRDSFPARHPDVWEAMTRKESTHFRNAQGLWTWAIPDPTEANLGVMVSQASHWWLVSLLPAGGLDAQYSETLFSIAPIILVSLLLSAFFIYLQAKREAQKNAWSQEREFLLSRLQRIANRIPGLVYEYQLCPDGSSFFPYASEAIREIYRISPEQVRKDSSKVFEALHSEDLERVKASIRKSADQLTAWIEEYRVRFKDGTVRWLSGNAMPQKQADGSVLWHGFIHDITEHKEQEARLEAIAERLRATVNSALDGIIVMNCEGRIVEFNPAAEHCFGYLREEAIGRLLSEAIVPERHREAHNRGLQHYLKTGEGPVLHKRIEIDAMKKDGSEFPVELAIDVAQSQDEELFIAYLRDISERKAAEKELRHNQARLKSESERNRLLLQFASDGIHILNSEGRIILASDSFARGLGYTTDEVIGMHPSQWDAFFKSEELDNKILPELFRKKDIFKFETQHRSKKGAIIDVEVATHSVTLDGQPLLFASSRNITDRKRAESALAESRDLLRTIIDTAPIRVYWKDRTLRYLGCNFAFAKAAGEVTPENVIGKNDFDLAWANQAETYMSEDLEVIQSGQAKLFFEEQQTTMDGRQIWLRSSKVPLRMGNNEIVGVLGISWDFTERKQAQLELKRKEAEFSKLALVASRTDNAVIFTDAEGLIEWVNDGFTRLTGWKLDEVIGRKPGEFLQGPETDPEAVRYMADCIRAGRGFKTELINYTRDGHAYWNTIEAQPIFNDEGELQHFMAIESDITEQKRAQESLKQYSQHLEQLVEERSRELQHNERLLGAIIKTTPNGLLLINHEGKIHMTNAALDQMFGYGTSELIDCPLEDLVPESRRDRHRELRKQFTQKPEARPMGIGLDLFGQRKDGTHFPIDVSLAVFSVNEEQYIQATIADITERKLAEESLRDLNANLERKVKHRTAELAAASAAKSEFLANMSHEIRTPMNGILGLAQLLEREPLTPDQNDMVKKIRNAGHSLLTIINDVLDFSKIEAGQLRIEAKPFDLAKILAQLNSLMGHTAHAKGVELSIENSNELAGEIIGDGLRVEQILVNLIGNAIKFTEEGSIRILVQPMEQTETTIRLRFEVKDTGMGIAQENLVNLFTPFTQADGTITRRFGGTGLGLSICKQLVQLMGGEIGVESNLGQGSTFWFELPFGLSFGNKKSLEVPDLLASIEGPRLSGVHCLVVDDSRLNREVVERMLTREGARVTLAADGLQALQYLQAQGNGIDVVLMDVQMPVMDGLSATRAIRDELGLRKLPVIAFTAGVLHEQREQAREAGCNDFVAKPVELGELVAVLIRWTSLATDSVPATVEDLSTEFPDIPGLDTQQAVSMLGGDRKFFLEFLKNFGAEFEATTDEIRKDLMQDDRKSAARRLHTLRGAAGYIGAVDLVRSAEVLEDAIKSLESDLDPLITEFDQKLMALLRASAPWRK